MTYKRPLGAIALAAVLSAPIATAQGITFDGGELSLEYNYLDRDNLGSDSADDYVVGGAAAVSWGSSFGVQGTIDHRLYDDLDETRLGVHAYWKGQNGLKLGGYAAIGQLDGSGTDFDTTSFGLAGMMQVTPEFHLMGQVGRTSLDDVDAEIDFIETEMAYAITNNWEAIGALNYYDNTFVADVDILDLSAGVAYHFDQAPLSLSAEIGAQRISTSSDDETLPQARLGLTYSFGGNAANVRERERLFKNDDGLDSIVGLLAN